MTITVLALDVATSTGWACSDGSSGVEDFSGKIVGRSLAKLEEPVRHAAIAARLEHWLGAKIILTGARVLVLERQMTHNRAHLLVGLRMIALLLGWKRRLQVEEVWATQWLPWAKACGWWEKGDEADAKALLGYFTEQRLPLLQQGEEL